MEGLLSTGPNPSSYHINTVEFLYVNFNCSHSFTLCQNYVWKKFLSVNQGFFLLNECMYVNFYHIDTKDTEYTHWLIE